MSFQWNEGPGFVFRLSGAMMVTTTHQLDHPRAGYLIVSHLFKLLLIIGYQVVAFPAQNNPIWDHLGTYLLLDGWFCSSNLMCSGSNPEVRSSNSKRPMIWGLFAYEKIWKACSNHIFWYLCWLIMVDIYWNCPWPSAITQVPHVEGALVQSARAVAWSPAHSLIFRFGAKIRRGDQQKVASKVAKRMANWCKLLFYFIISHLLGGFLSDL